MIINVSYDDWRKFSGHVFGSFSAFSMLVLWKEHGITKCHPHPTRNEIVIDFIDEKHALAWKMKYGTS